LEDNKPVYPIDIGFFGTIGEMVCANYIPDMI
jgi:hypothetical protein